MNMQYIQTHPHSQKLKLNTLAFGARRAMREAAAFPALFSSIKLIVELMISKVIIPTKSCQSGAFPYTNI
jgi:hypothetical protein